MRTCQDSALSISKIKASVPCVFSTKVIAVLNEGTVNMTEHIVCCLIMSRCYWNFPSGPLLAWQLHLAWWPFNSDLLKMHQTRQQSTVLNWPLAKLMPYTFLQEGPQHSETNAFILMNKQPHLSSTFLDAHSILHSS